MTQLIIIVSSNVTLQWRRKQIASGGARSIKIKNLEKQRKKSSLHGYGYPLTPSPLPTPMCCQCLKTNSSPFYLFLALLLIVSPLQTVLRKLYGIVCYSYVTTWCPLVDKSILYIILQVIFDKICFHNIHLKTHCI